MWKPGITKEFNNILETIEDLGKKWVLLILLTIYFYEKISFGMLKKLTKPITSKVLSQKLKFLEDSGFIFKEIIINNPKRVEYYITETGKQLISFFISFKDIFKINSQESQLKISDVNNYFPK